MRVTTVANWLSLVFATILVAVSLIFAYVLLAPIDVVTDWRLNVQEGTYHPGSDVTLKASYRKLRNVNGEAKYYLECKNPRGSLVRYTVSQSEGNRPAGSGSVDIPLKLPLLVANLPTDCRIAVSVDYHIYTFRNFVENNSSNYFKVEEN